jgi:O-antigen/teichoic acid export membrane protein
MTIAAVTMAVGLALVPVIHLLIEKVDISLGYLRIVYVLFVFQNSVSYLFSYKISLVQADQKQYVYTNINMVCRTVGSIALLVIMRVTKSYLPYLIGNISLTIITNAIASRAVDKRYPYLKDDPTLPAEEKKQIFTNVKNIFVKQIAGKVVNSTDNILISKLVGTLMVGYCGNYTMITNVFTTLADKVWDSTEASFGNLFVTADEEKKIQVLKRLTFIFFIFALIGGVGIFACIQSFIMIWLKSETYLISEEMVFLYSLLLFTTITYRPLSSAMHMTGYFEIGRNISGVSAVVNLVVSIILGKIIGLPGIFIGTCCTYLIEITSKTYFLFNRYFKSSPVSYALLWIKMLAIFCADCGIVHVISQHISYGYILKFLILGAISVALAAVFVLVVFARSEEMDFVMYLINEYMGRLKNRNRD